MKPKANVSVFVVEPYGSSFPRLIQKLKKGTLAQVVECASPRDAIGEIRKAGCGLVLCHASKPEHLVQHITLFKVIGELLAQGKVRAIATVQARNPLIDEKLMLYGVSEILMEPVNEKSFDFKVERYLRSFQEQIAGSESQVEEIRQVSEPKRKPQADPTTSAAKLRFTEPLDFKSDCWLVEGGGVRNVAERWVIRLKGPGPEAGRWSEIKGGTAGAGRSWKWIPQDPDHDQFISEVGEWVFRGDRAPDSVDGCWWFTGRRPSLSFLNGAEVYGDKFTVGDQGTLLVAKDSEQARSYEHLLDETWHKIIKQMDSEISASVSLPEEAPEEAREQAPEEAPVEAAAPGEATVAIVDPEEIEDVETQTKKAPSRIRAVEPPGPSIGPLAIAFLMSELVCKKNMSLSEVGERYCAYVSAACGDLKVELWTRDLTGWFCVGTSHSTPSQLEAKLEEIKPEVWFIGPEQIAAPVLDRDRNAKGALVFSGAGAEKVAPQYALSVAKMAFGLVLAMSERKGEIVENQTAA